MGVIDDLSDDEKKIWHTYLYCSRKLTRQSVNTLEPPIELKSLETDKDLECYKQSMPANFYKSINSIIFSIFAAEFRINLAARKEGIYKKKLAKYFDENVHENWSDERIKSFEDLSHYLKWRNFPFVWGGKETKQYVDSIKKLKKWITLRNHIVHAKYSKLSKLNITPKDALECYESVVDSIFELNIILDNDRSSHEESKRQVSLKP